MERLVNEDLLLFKNKMGYMTLELPIDPEHIAEIVFQYATVEASFSELGYYSYEESQEVMGGIWPPGHLFRNGKSKVLAANLDVVRPDVTKRFTFAHELGHASLHFDHGESRGQLSLFVTEPQNTNKPIRCRFNERSDSLEIQANLYAGRLLMPVDLIVQSIPSKTIDLDNSAKTLQLLFGVSRQALEIRLQDLGYELLNRVYPEKSDFY